MASNYDVYIQTEKSKYPDTIARRATILVEILKVKTSFELDENMLVKDFKVFLHEKFSIDRNKMILNWCGRLLRDDDTLKTCAGKNERIRIFLISDQKPVYSDHLSENTQETNDNVAEDNTTELSHNVAHRKTISSIQQDDQNRMVHLSNPWWYPRFISAMSQPTNGYKQFVANQQNLHYPPEFQYYQQRQAQQIYQPFCNPWLFPNMIQTPQKSLVQEGSQDQLNVFYNNQSLRYAPTMLHVLSQSLPVHIDRKF